MEASSSCNFLNKQKQQKQKLQNDDLFRSSSEDDISLLNEPNKTTFSGYNEVKRAYENGTEEIRHLLKQECSFIYECKACRNLFRSLFHFIKHKRLYCKKSIQQHFPDNSDEKSNIVLQASESREPWLDTIKNANISLNADVTKRNSYNSKSMSSSSLALPKCNVSAKNTLNCVTPLTHLERQPTNTQAVYKNFNLQSSNNIKAEVDQSEQYVSKHMALTADGQHSNSIRTFPNNTYAFTTTKDFKYNCEICNINFKTKSSLAVHFQEKHTSSTYVFQCPICSITFLQPTAVVRHLANEHKKPLRRIRKMREAILKRRIQIADMHLKAPSRELKRLQLNDCTDIENGSDINPTANGMKSTCKFCKRKFERHAAYSAHLLKCSSKNIEEETVTKDISNDSSQAPSKRLKVLPLKVLQSSDTEIQRNDNAIERDVHHNIEIKNDTFIPDVKPNNDLISSDTKKVLNALTTEVVDSSLHIIGTIPGILTPDTTPNNKIVSEPNNSSVCESGKKLKSKQNKNCDVTPVKKLTCRCKICNKQFNALSNLRRHISMFHYRASRFGCTLCEYRAFRRYDIVNHLGFVHKMTGEREMMALKYVSVKDINYSKDDMDSDILVISNTDNLLEIPPDEMDSKPEEEKCDKNESNNSEINRIVFVKTDQANLKRKKVRKAISHLNDGERRPIRNRIKAESKDFLYDFSKIQQQDKDEKVLVTDASRLSGKRRSSSHKNSQDLNVAVPVKITRYRLRTEPLLPSNLELVKGAANRLCKYVIGRGLAAPSTVPELPAERPQIRPRLISTIRTDVPAVPIIETSRLEADSLKPKLFNDSFLEKFATSANPTFRMKPPLLNVEHSPLNAILQRFDATLQHNGICRNKTRLPNDLHAPAIIDKVAIPNTNSNISEIGHSKGNIVDLPDEQLPTKNINTATSSDNYLSMSITPPSVSNKTITLMKQLNSN